ncbi:MAG: PilZ domain-containing protein [Terriglobia bacterium]
MPAAVSSGVRRDGRVRVHMPVDLRNGSWGPDLDDEAFTIDLSSRGIRVCTILGLSPGELVVITAIDEQERPIEGRVVWVGSAGTTLERQAGIEFLKPLFRLV